MRKLTRTEIAYQQGFTVGSESGKSAANPYYHSSDEFKAWNLGWLDGSRIANATSVSAS